MLDLEEFKTIWEIAFLWEGAQPPDNDPSNIPDGVRKKIEKLIWAFREDQLKLRDADGQYVYDGKDLLDFLFLNQARKQLRKCYKQKNYPKSVLDNFFIKRSDLLKWCQEDFTTLPEFWVEDASKPMRDAALQPKQLFGRHINQEQDKQLCQSIAQALWDLDPNIHPAHMAKSWAILKYGNGNHYKGKDEDFDTIKKWIKEVDPQRDSRGDGRPPKVIYLIDLKNGGLEKN
ncbi:MAG: hypothetical protein ACXWAT_10120 [Methylobacter sp.]